MKIETMKIVCEENERGGYAIINKSDFDPKTMTEYGAKKRGRPSKTEKE